ncbi:conserved hypothetical protein [Talaromyces stipitatus ATCC 10500]|uniref:Zn(2)-C6 fungal-type domain-containing protein n=1 Tax=Talaromyces stipitatus (strain ATCC 10500 / CBS 375.48 / QM 6759 / NRRL 1006) TaxID=441959 RepID=B8MDL6_TALSN|nr:uncharacterized protein TSTA_117560 [Talaromyces stipitatus ATCC 10500]EED17979.1 conserved hypothetical protein [Talaromyces stipitatus ATCC 10500]
MEFQTTAEASRSGVRPSNAPIRGRPQLSCTPCKRRKLKCDRARPCDNCIKRREADTCVYPTNGSTARDQTRESKKTKKRIERLESLVMELLDRGSLNHEGLSEGPSTTRDYESHAHHHLPHHASETGHETDSSPAQGEVPPVRRVPNLAASSSSSSLWETVLQDIGEIKLYFEEHESEFEKQLDKVEDARNPSAEPYVLEGSPGKWDIDTFAHDLPPRPVMDLLVANYFGASSLIRPILHPKKFLRQYEKFWQDQYSVSKSWLGTLFVIMRTAIHTARQAGLDLSATLGDMDEAQTLFRMRTKQILMTELHAKPTLERLTLLAMHLDAEFIQCQDTSIAVWINVATAVRMALKLGLHREPSSYGDLSPFECEMRRRLWLAISQTDVLLSWQVGLPSMIPQGQCDTMLPRNLHEDDFDEDCTALPAPRPWNEMTKISPFLVKAGLLRVFTKIASHIQDIHPKDSDVPILERELYAERDALPAMFKVKSMQESLLDHPAMIMRRISIDQTLHSGLCVLHRRLMPLARSNPQYSHSRKVAIDAALTLLNYQAICHYESGPTGRLAGHKWLSTSVIRHDYLLAAMLICLDLKQGVDETTHPSSSDIILWGHDRREEMMAALETSYHVWRASKDTSIDAFRASEAVAVLLKKIRSAESTVQSSETTVSSMPSVESLEISPEQFVPIETDPYNLTLPFSEMVASPGAIDWVEFDRYVLGGNVPMNT